MLNDPQCRNAKAKTKPYKLRDGKGLYLEVKPNGSKVWRYRFEIGGKESVYTLGEYCHAPNGETDDVKKERIHGGMLTLAEAREERGRCRGMVKNGMNPVHQRKLDRIKRAREHATTFKAVALEWLALKDWEEITKKRRLYTLERWVFPAIGSLPIKSITPAHVLDILTSTAKRAPTVAAEIKRTLSAVFDLAVSTLRADTDPVYPVRKALPTNKTQHKRALSAVEIGQLLRDMDGDTRSFQTTSVFKLMWLTLCRPNEAVGAEWSEFDLDARIWRIPASRMKKRKEHAIPLPIQAVELLRAMYGITGRHTHVFPHRDDRNKPMTDNALRCALKALGWAGKYSPLATRTTGSTRLNEMGYPADWIERQLAHVEPNAVRRTYNHAHHLDDRRKMMQAWADYLDGLKNGAAVIPLHKAV